MNICARSVARAVLSLTLAALLLACGREPSAPTSPTPTPSVASPAAVSPVSAPEAVSGSEAIQQAATDENTAYLQRRRKDPPVIGGCEERCETPELAVGHLFDALGRRDHEALRRSFDWSILLVDGEAHGERWAGMWARVQEHEARSKGIEAWLKGWIGWLDQLADGESLVRARVNGVIIKPLPGRTDVVEMTFNHPRLKQPRGEPIWRFELTRRGWEWLISRIDHEPGRRKHRTPPAGSPSPGRL